MGQSPVAKIYLEKRAGKVVTVVSGLHTYGEARLSGIARELKAALGAGGTLKNGVIEIQGDKAAQIKAWFNKSKEIE
jgi:translation initiation factor 1